MMLLGIKQLMIHWQVVEALDHHRMGPTSTQQIHKVFETIPMQWMGRGRFSASILDIYEMIEHLCMLWTDFSLYLILLKKLGCD